MRKKMCVTFVTLSLVYITHASGRDFTECSTSFEQNEGFMYYDNRQDRCCLTSGATCGDVGTFYCAGFFNMPETVWRGTTHLAYNISGDGCYVEVSAGKMISDTYDLFDEDRDADVLLQDCESGGYCSGLNATYAQLTRGEYAGTTMVGWVQCPDAPNVFINAARTQYATVGNGHISSKRGATKIADCYIVSGTYYDVTGTYVLSSNDCTYKE